MRVLLSTRGSRGDVEPLAALAEQLQALGAETAVVASPDQEFTDVLDGVGVPHLKVGGSVRDLVTGRNPGQMERVLADFEGHARELMDDYAGALLAAAEDGCDAIVATGLFPSVVAARAVSELLGIRYVCAVLQPTTLPSPTHSPFPMKGWKWPDEITDNLARWEWDIEKMNGLFGAPANGFRESLGLDPVDNVRDHTYTDQPWLATDPILSPWEPTELDVVQTGAWILANRRPLSAELEAFLEAGEAPVYAGFGSMPMQAAKDASEVAVEAARANGRRLVLASGWAELASADAGEDVLVIGGVNQQALFPRVAAIVHHGGAGTTTTATRSGSPQVVVPQIVDQPYWAERVAELGAGVAHAGPVPTVESLSATLAKALAPETVRRAAEVGAMIRTDGAEVAAERLVDEVR
jgi:vancomycin aglycone glucosyltransferase